MVDIYMEEIGIMSPVVQAYSADMKYLELLVRGSDILS